jgi:hypothetical protein
MILWLEGEQPPEIVAPPSEPGSAYRLSVPNNAMDLVGRAWSRGNTSGTGDANPARPAAAHENSRPGGQHLRHRGREPG